MTVNGAVRRFPILSTVLLAGFNLGLAQTAATPAKVPYLDPSLPIETRLADILSRLTLEEKISLLGETQPAIPRLDIRRYHFGNEALQGVVRPGKFTVFPMSIGLASTWDPALLKEMASAISDEARARYNVDRGEMESIPSAQRAVQRPAYFLVSDYQYGA